MWISQYFRLNWTPVFNGFPGGARKAVCTHLRMRKNDPPLSKTRKFSCFRTEGDFMNVNYLILWNLQPYKNRTIWFWTKIVRIRAFSYDFRTGSMRCMSADYGQAVRKHDFFTIFNKVSYKKRWKIYIIYIRLWHSLRCLIWCCLRTVLSFRWKIGGSGGNRAEKCRNDRTKIRTKSCGISCGHWFRPIFGQKQGKKCPVWEDFRPEWGKLRLWMRSAGKRLFWHSDYRL